MRTPVAIHRLSALLALLALIPVAALAIEMPEQALVTVEYHSLDGSTLLYRAVRETSQDTATKKILTTFKNLEGEKIIQTVEIYRLEALQFVSFHFQDYRTSEIAQMVKNGAAVKYRARDNAAAGFETGSIAWDRDTLFSGNITHFIYRNWERMMEWKSVDYSFIVASRRTKYSFRMTRTQATAFGGAGRVVFVMEASSWIMRRVIKPIYFVMNAAPPHRLLEIRGTSYITDTAGELLKLIAKYYYGNELN